MHSANIISSDSHIWEPTELWTSTIGKQYGERAPHVVQEEDSDWWYCGGRKVIDFHAAGGQVGKRFTDPKGLTETGRLESVRPGAWDPVARIEDLESDGVEGDVIYPSVAAVLYWMPDGALLNDIFRVYNDWIAGFCQANPRKLKAIAALNVDDVDWAVRELQRCARLGLAGAMIPVYPLLKPPTAQGKGYESPAYEPLWAAAQDLGVPLSLHVSTQRQGAGQGFPEAMANTRSFRVNADHWVRMSLGDMVLTGVFERYPRLKVVSAEMEITWAAHFIERMDFTYTQRAHKKGWVRLKGDILPSDYFKRNVSISFQEDPLGIRLRDYIGVHTLMWGSDYPHIESTFPESRRILTEMLRDCTPDERDAIVGKNAANLYGFN